MKRSRKKWVAGSWRPAAKEEEHLCALMLMTGECMEIDPAKRGKRSEGLELLAGTECPIPSRHPRLRSESLPHSLLTGCGASCVHSLHWKWSGKWQSCHVWLRDKSAYRFIRELDVSLFFQIDHEGWVGVFADSAPPQTRITTESIAHNHWVSNSQNYGSITEQFCCCSFTA